MNLSWGIYYYIRIESGWIKFANTPSFFAPMIVVYVYWLLIFSIAGLYQHWYVRSRFDEFSLVFKSVSTGCVILFFAIYVDDYVHDAKVISRFLIFIYWFFMVMFTSYGRFLIRGFQFRLFEKGIGLRNTLIVGTGQKATELFEMISEYPRLGYKFIGMISNEEDQVSEHEIGKLSSIKDIIKDKEISEVLIASEQKDKNLVLTALNYCADENVHVKIMPELSEIFSGMAKTDQIYGIPLIEVKSQLMSLPSRAAKRLIDISISLFIIIVFSPVIIFTAFVIKLTSKGPVLYFQTRLGRQGKAFKVYKFRSMVTNAEESGPIWAEKDDPRVTAFGKFMRKLRLDEMPQFFNVLMNEMSIVGPRPERPYFVEQLKKEIPYYTRRLSVKPGITGWAQVKHTYDTSVDDVKKKLQYDFYYIENMSLSLDFKIMMNTLFVIFSMKGH